MLEYLRTLRREEFDTAWDGKKAFSLRFFLSTSGLLPAPTAIHESVVMPLPTPLQLPTQTLTIGILYPPFCLAKHFWTYSCKQILKKNCWHLIWKLPPLHQYLYIWYYKNILFALMYYSYPASYSIRKQKGLAVIRNWWISSLCSALVKKVYTWIMQCSLQSG